MLRSEAKLLVVDDLPTDRGFLVEILGDGGFTQIEQTYSGENAVELAESYGPHMILMDTDMPRGMYGYEACRIIREQCSRPLVIIGLSNIATEERKRLWLEAGADDFFDKDVPDVDSSGFYQTLDNYLNGLEH